MSDVVAFDELEVFRDTERVGTLKRTRAGARFDYDEAFLERRRGDTREVGAAIHLPYRQRTVETTGVNLPPYFAGLLPEGLRLEAVIRGIKTSRDDLFSLLAATGADPIGDLSVRAPGVEAPSLEVKRPLEEVVFSELLKESLHRSSEPGEEPSLPGVQEKVSGRGISFPVRLASRRNAHILKLNPPDKPRLVENEAFFMTMAKDLGLEVAETVRVVDRTGASGLLVTRFDRQWSKAEKRLVPRHQEDGCQFLDRYPADKYRVTMKELAEGLRVCAAPIVELARLIRLTAFSYLIGNGDLHAKNLSVLAAGPGGSLVLSPAYDLLSTLPYRDRRMALKLDGRDDRLHGRYFVDFGHRFGVRAAAVKRMLTELYERSAPWLDRLDALGLDDAGAAELLRTLKRRRQELVAFGGPASR